MFANLGRLQQFRRVVLAITIELQESEERAHAAQDAALRTGIDADVVQTCRKCLKVFECHFSHVLPLSFQIVEQFLEVVLIGVERITRHVALQLQVAHIVLHNVFLHLICKGTIFRPKMTQINTD